MDNTMSDESYRKRVRLWKKILSYMLLPATAPLYLIYWICNGISNGAESQLNSFGNLIKSSSKKLAKRGD